MMLSEVNILALLKRSSTVMTRQLEQLWKPRCVCVLLQWFHFTDDTESTLPAFTETYTVMSSEDWLILRQGRDFVELEAVVPAWFTFITRMSLATLRRFQHLTAEVRKWAALKACQTEDGKILLRNFLGFIWPLKK